MEKIIKTDDGSITIYSELFHENCHSLSGAKTETLKYYIEGCEIIKRSQLNIINILEIGFGTGLGASLSFEASNNLNYIAMELDENMIKWAIKNQNSSIIKSLKKYDDRYISEDLKLTVIIGDAREKIYELKKSGIKFHAIYQDAFSPKVNLSLWTEEWFKDLKDIADQSCIMSTYSVSSGVRKAMLNSGWTIFNVNTNFGRKKSSTIAKLSGITQLELIEHLNRSHVGAFKDKDLK